jgi:hypothetical protein
MSREGERTATSTDDAMTPDPSGAALTRPVNTRRRGIAVVEIGSHTRPGLRPDVAKTIG